VLDLIAPQKRAEKNPVSLAGLDELVHLMLQPQGSLALERKQRRSHQIRPHHLLSLVVAALAVEVVLLLWVLEQRQDDAWAEGMASLDA
jgi:hypothetical protein